MSHAAEIKTEFKRIDTVLKAFERAGWKIVTKSKINTYPSDPKRNTVFEYVAKNPKQGGYDVGLIVKPNEAIEFCFDPYDRSVLQQLGTDFALVKANYAFETVSELYTDIYVENVEDGMILTIEDGQ